jgi:dTMP kinase
MILGLRPPFSGLPLARSATPPGLASPRRRARATLVAMARSSESPARGRFITIEGPEGAGKTTQAARLEAHLRDDGIPVVRTREPGGTRLGEVLRDILLAGGRSAVPIDPLTDALLFSAARRQLVSEVIRPALEAGTTVICTRFADSTIAYQGYGAGVPLSELRDLQRIATDGLRPDLTILLDLPPEAGLERKAPDDQTRFELGFDLDFHRRVRQGFLELAEAEPGRITVVDARGAAERVWEAVRDAVGPSIGAAVTVPGEPNGSAGRIIP